MESANLDSEAEWWPRPAFIAFYSAFSLNLFIWGLNTLKFSTRTLFRTFKQVVKRVLVKALHLSLLKPSNHQEFDIFYFT